MIRNHFNHFNHFFVLLFEEQYIDMIYLAFGLLTLDILGSFKK
jgi:hypothetical protein